MSTDDLAAREARARRALARQGLRLKIMRNSSDYGPYAIVDPSNNTLTAWGIETPEQTYQDGN